MQGLLDIARRQIAVAISEQDHLITAELGRISSDAAAKGYLRSGRHIVERDRACSEAIKNRAAFVWEILHRCVTNAGVAFTSDMAARLKAFAQPYLANNVGALTLRPNQGMDRMGLGPITPTLSETARENALAWLEAEIDLFCYALSQAPQVSEYKPQPVINIHGSIVGVVQTGDQSTANLKVSAPTIYHESARQALEELKREIQATGQDGGSLFLVDETTAELAKPVPDKTRLASLITAAKSCLTGAIETAPKIPAAIDAVQKAISLLPFG